MSPDMFFFLHPYSRSELCKTFAGGHICNAASPAAFTNICLGTEVASNVNAGDELDQPLTDSTGPAQEEDDASQGSDGHQDVQHTSQADVIHLNLARLLSKTQQHEQAAQLYGLLQALGALRSRPEAACSYAAALEGLGERGRAQAVLRGVIDDDEAPVKVAAYLASLPAAYLLPQHLRSHIATVALPGCAVGFP